MNKPITVNVSLDTPIIRGEQNIESISLRKPQSGELRGVTLTDLLQMDVNALATVLPRITMPTLTKNDVLTMDPADLTQMGTEVAGFLVPKAHKVDNSPTA